MYDKFVFVYGYWKMSSERARMVVYGHWAASTSPAQLLSHFPHHQFTITNRPTSTDAEFISMRAKFALSTTLSVLRQYDHIHLATCEYS